MKAWLAVFLLSFQMLGAFELKSQLATAQAGDFIVYLYKSHITLVRIAKYSPSELVIEEITAPNGDYKWQEWLSQNAPGHTSWTISTVDPATMRTSSSYSLDERSPVSIAELQFLPMLLQLELKEVPESQQKKIGPEPLEGELDMRRFWHPKIVWEGVLIHPPVIAYKAIWPKDESELAGKVIEVYIPQKEALSYLPYWIEVGGGLLKAKIQAIDSGKGLTSKLLTADVSNAVDRRS